MKIKGYIVKIFALLGCLLILCSCGTLKATDRPVRSAKRLDAVAWQQQKQQLLALKEFKVMGKMSITYQGKTDIVAFTWLQQGNNYSIRISGPMNLESVRLVGNDKSVVLWLTDRKRLVAKTPEELVYAQFGWILPVSNLVYWVKGIPVPKHAKKTIKSNGYFEQQGFEQQGWQVQYIDFMLDQGLNLPSRILFSKQKVKIRMVIKKWIVIG